MTKDAQIEFKACNANNMSDDNPVSLDPVSRDVRDEHDVLRDEQRADATLERAWVWAQKNKNNFFVKDELLYHRDKVLQQNVQQICLPTAHRNEVCRLAHDMCHLGYKHTKEKLRLNFFWPGMSKTIRQYVDTCLACQKKARAVIKDRVPISIVPRDQVPFSHLYIDVVGPLLNKAEYNFCLCLIDSHTRFPFALPLKSVNAKAVCECLLQVFSLVGIPIVITSDNATHFTSQLNDKFMELFGCKPKFSTVLLPEGNSLVERMNASLKKMLAHVSQKYPKQWHKLCCGVCVNLGMRR